MSTESMLSSGIAPSILEYCSQFVAWIGADFETCTIITPTFATTFAHNRDWNVGDMKTIVLNDRRSFRVSVFKIDPRLDVIWLRSEEKMCQVAPDTNLPSEGRSYFMIGHSGRQLQEDPRAVRDGIFCSTKITLTGHVIGSSGSSKGDSGAPVFWKTNGYLLGMNVGCEAVPIEQLGGRLIVGESPRSLIVPISSLLLPLNTAEQEMTL